jgi:hypothetical protein
VRKRRGGGALLWAACVFLALQVSLAVVHESSLFFRDPEDGARLALLRRCNRRANPLVLALGTSRTANGLRTETPSAATQPLWFNYGITGSNLPEQSLRLRRLLAEGIRPRLVCVELLPAHLARRTEGASGKADRLGWRELRRLPRYGFSKQSGYVHWGRARAVPWYSDRAVLLSRWLPWLLPDDFRLNRFWEGVNERGWRAYGRERVSAAEYRLGLEEARHRYQAVLTAFHIEPGPDRALRDLLGLCRRERIEVVLYLMPESSAFGEWYTPETQVLLDGYLQGLHKEYGVRLIDARAWLGDDAFADGHHLLPEGAGAFTARFVREVAPPRF